MAGGRQLSHLRAGKLGSGLMLVAGSQWEPLEPVTETDDGTPEPVSWKWQGPERAGMLSSSAKLDFGLL